MFSLHLYFVLNVLFICSGAMLGKAPTEQDRFSYSELFIAIKVAADASFRSFLFALAVDVGKRDARTKWISNLVLTGKKYFKLRCKVSDEAFVGRLSADSEVKMFFCHPIFSFI
jgi:hypothetical protein